MLRWLRKLAPPLDRRPTICNSWGAGWCLCTMDNCTAVQGVNWNIFTQCFNVTRDLPTLGFCVSIFSAPWSFPVPPQQLSLRSDNRLAVTSSWAISEMFILRNLHFWTCHFSTHSSSWSNLPIIPQSPMHSSLTFLLSLPLHILSGPSETSWFEHKPLP